MAIGSCGTVRAVVPPVGRLVATLDRQHELAPEPELADDLALLAGRRRVEGLVADQVARHQPYVVLGDRHQVARARGRPAPSGPSTAPTPEPATAAVAGQHDDLVQGHRLLPGGPGDGDRPAPSDVAADRSTAKKWVTTRSSSATAPRCSPTSVVRDRAHQRGPGLVTRGHQLGVGLGSTGAGCGWVWSPRHCRPPVKGLANRTDAHGETPRDGTREPQARQDGSVHPEDNDPRRPRPGGERGASRPDYGQAGHVPGSRGTGPADQARRSAEDGPRAASKATGADARSPPSRAGPPVARLGWRGGPAARVAPASPGSTG